EVVLDADRAQFGHDVLADPVVQHALAFEAGLLLAVEGGGVVLEILDQSARLGAFVENLGLAFVDFLAPSGRHGQPSPRGKGYRWPETKKRAARFQRARSRLIGLALSG